MANEIKFDVEQVRSTMGELEDLFSNFAEATGSLNNYIETIINAGEDSAINGVYGEKLLAIWSANSSTFEDFHANFKAWNETVAVVSATNEDFVVDTLALYRDNGSTLSGVQEAREFVTANGRTGASDKSELSEEAKRVLGNTSTTAAGISVVPEEEQQPTVNVGQLVVGDTMQASIEQGQSGTFKYQGLVQRGDMTQEQIFSDEQGNLYYYEDGIMKPVHVSITEFDYNSRVSTTNYDEQATVDDLESKTLYFQNDNGEYGGNNANKTYDTLLDTDGSVGNENGYSIKTYDYNNFDINSDYEGKGTTILVPDENINGTNNAAKEMITTSIIDVRNNIAKEATEMQTYLDTNRDSLTAEQISTIESQITSRNELASQMGEDVQFGVGVDDGAIGDWGTFYTNTDYEDVMQTINGYNEKLDSLESIDEIINGNN